jgi:hypothetical protein
VAKPMIENQTVPIERTGRSSVAPWSVQDRLRRLAPALAAIIVVGVVTAGQLVEDLSDSAPLQLLSPTDAIRRWTVIGAILYLVVISRVVDGLVERSVTALTGVVQVEQAKIDRYRRSLDGPGIRVDGTLLLISAIVVTLLFPVLGTSLPIDDPVRNQPMLLPADTVGALLVLASYTLLGWALLSLVSSTISRARALGELSRERFEVDVFDTSRLLPFGNIALATSLAPAGIIVMFLIGFGRPTAPLGWSVLLAATLASILALILPLRPIHRQMARAKQDALRGLNARIRDVYERAGGADNLVDAGGATDLDDAEIARLNNRVGTLVALRRTVGEMTTWPFRDTLALARAVLIASAPLIYTIVAELIKAFLINPLVP